MPQIEWNTLHSTFYFLNTNSFVFIRDLSFVCIRGS